MENFDKILDIAMQILVVCTVLYAGYAISLTTNHEIGLEDEKK